MATVFDVDFAVVFAIVFAIVLATAFVATEVFAAGLAAARATKFAVTGRAPRVVVAGTRRDDLVAGFLTDVRALLSALADFPDFLVPRAAFAVRRAVFVDCVLMPVI
ncbi:MAG: hypothetical protein Q7T81_10815 [Pseudolabrys sp.]|nr:hypothetical protein [Pseudolabrys sp.]